MSVITAGKTVADSVYAYRFIRLIQKDFTDWEAFKKGIIDERGNVIKRPKTDEEKSAYTPFHGAVRSIKKMLNRVPGAQTWATIAGAISAVGSRYGLTEEQIDDVSIIAKPLFESMVAGDSGGDQNKIASGTNSGDIVNAGPVVIKNKRKSLKELYYTEK